MVHRRKLRLRAWKADPKGPEVVGRILRITPRLDPGQRVYWVRVAYSAKLKL